MTTRTNGTRNAEKVKAIEQKLRDQGLHIMAQTIATMRKGYSTSVSLNQTLHAELRQLRATDKGPKMSEGDFQDAARAILHVYVMFAVGYDFNDEEFRYTLAEEVAASGAENAAHLADAVRKEIDRQHPNKRHPT